MRGRQEAYDKNIYGYIYVRKRKTGLERAQHDPFFSVSESGIMFILRESRPGTCSPLIE